jgi:hypothetical protein
MAAFDVRWMKAWQDVVNAAPSRPFISRYFTGDFLLGFGKAEYVVSVREGRIVDIRQPLVMESRWQFGLRAPQSTWERFLEPTPLPMYTDVWAMTQLPEGRLVVDGDVKVIWQHMRTLFWMLDLLRRVPVGA